MEIWTYLTAEVSQEIADRFLKEIGSRFDQIVLFPFEGAARPQFARDLRMIPHPPYAIYYLPRLREIVVVRVLHGSRDAAALAEHEGFLV